jgi:hypothetical protein
MRSTSAMTSRCEGSGSAVEVEGRTESRRE